MRLPSVRKALIKLLVATSILAALILSCFIDSVGDARGLIVFFIVVLGFPITLLTGIDASRVIKREAPKHKSLAFARFSASRIWNDSYRFLDRLSRVLCAGNHS
jgi:hypothetical protein